MLIFTPQALCHMGKERACTRAHTVDKDMMVLYPLISLPFPLRSSGLEVTAEPWASECVRCIPQCRRLDFSWAGRGKVNMRGSPRDCCCNWGCAKMGSSCLFFLFLTLIAPHYCLTTVEIAGSLDKGHNLFKVLLHSPPHELIMLNNLSI